MDNQDGGVRVLLVDDEQALLESLRKVLSRRAMEVFTAQTGDEALKLLEDTPVDVVVLDISMPDLDGIQAANRIRTECPQTQILILTMHESDEYFFKMLQATL